MPRRALPAIALLVVSIGCSDDDAPVVSRSPRTVTVMQLENASPGAQQLLPGVVQPYRETRLSFEVPGRVISLRDVGDDVKGEQLNRDGRLVVEGEVIAELDSAPYERALAQVERRLDAARAQRDAQVVQLEQVLPARLASARSNVEAAELNVSYAKDDVASSESAVSLAQTTLERNRSLLTTNAVSEITVRESEASLSTANARLAQARTLVTTRKKELDAARSRVAEALGAIALQKANVLAQEAAIDELDQLVLDARKSVQDCVLRAPFGGRITAINVGEGSVVNAGTTVAVVTMMTPIQIALTLSADVEAELLPGTDMTVYPMRGNEVDWDRGLRAVVYEKSGVADGATRTFPVGLLAPNRRHSAGGETADLPTTSYLLPVLRNPLDVPGVNGLYTVNDAIGTDAEGDYVLRVAGLRTGQRSADVLQQRQAVERVAVELGDSMVRIASFSLIELIGDSGLEETDLLVAFPSPEFLGGFVLADNRWVLRPGDLVQVALVSEKRAAGIFVPVQAIRERNGETSVIVVEDGELATLRSVRVLESVGELRRVEGVQAGEQIVVEGVHFLRDGERVSIIEGASL